MVAYLHFLQPFARVRGVIRGMLTPPEAPQPQPVKHTSKGPRPSWHEALRAFAAALESVPNDGPSMTFIKRIDGLATNPPGDGWDGSWHLEQK
jgi:hypothetical protein